MLCDFVLRDCDMMMGKKGLNRLSVFSAVSSLTGSWHRSRRVEAKHYWVLGNIFEYSVKHARRTLEYFLHSYLSIYLPIFPRSGGHSMYWKTREFMSTHFFLAFNASLLCRAVPLLWSEGNSLASYWCKACWSQWSRQQSWCFTACERLYRELPFETCILPRQHTRPNLLILFINLGFSLQRHLGDREHLINLNENKGKRIQYLASKKTFTSYYFKQLM